MCVEREREREREREKERGGGGGGGGGREGGKKGRGGRRRESGAILTTMCVSYITAAICTLSSLPKQTAWVVFKFTPGKLKVSTDYSSRVEFTQPVCSYIALKHAWNASSTNHRPLTGTFSPLRWGWVEASIIHLVVEGGGGRRFKYHLIGLLEWRLYTGNQLPNGCTLMQLL